MYMQIYLQVILSVWLVALTAGNVVEPETTPAEGNVQPLLSYDEMKALNVNSFLVPLN